MLRRNIVGLVVCIAVLGVASLGFANVPDLSASHAVAASGATQVSVFVTPDGLGYLMTQARAVTTPPLDVVDATITVTLWDSGNNPIFAYPFEDLWLETSMGGLAGCSNGTIADGATDIDGQATFTGPFYAGGHSDFAGNEVTKVYVSGNPLVGSDLNILFNSADINGDGVVSNLSGDLGGATGFAGYYTNGTYDYAIDYFYDGLENLSDLVLFAGAFNTACP